MTPLRAQMIKAMQMRGFSERTHQSYLAAVKDLARYCRRSPDTLAIADLDGYFEHLVTERKLAPASVRLALNAIRFLFVQVLKWPSFQLGIAFPKRPQRIPELLTRAEVARILGACTHPRYRMMLTLAYGCGLRLSELLAVKVRDIDGERRLLRVEQGKGAKDRLVPISPTLLEQLRGYWRLARPSHLLFPARLAPNIELSPTSVQKQYTTAKGAAGVRKIGGIHALRHAFATHQLEAGMPVHRLQRLLGHGNLHSTLRYVHWVPSYREGEGELDLIARLEVGHD
jgi:integrase/recombinase XerD